MHINRPFFSLVLGMSFISPVLGAEPLFVDVWPGRTPGDVGIKGEEFSRTYNSPLVGPTRLIRNVTKPTLTVYRPEREKTRARR